MARGPYRLLRRLYHSLPLTTNQRLRLKALLFSRYPGVFGHTIAYRNWSATERQRAWHHGHDGNSVGADSASGREHVPLTSFPGVDSAVRVIAFYLPQFYPIPENDRWWGRGFTEWTNVSRATPQFVGHYQPHLPGEFGFYDLRLVEIQRRQIELAKAYGVHGFCFYHYWFAGKKLLDLPLRQFLEHKDLDLAFCVCWANENWTRAWDGLEQQILIGQSHSPEDDLEFIRDLEPVLRDERYIRIEGRPLLIVYRPALLPDPKATARRWREYCRSSGVGEIFLACTWAFEIKEPADFGFDAAVEFPPNNQGAPVITDQLKLVNADFRGVVHDYRYLIEESRHYNRPRFCLFRGVTPNWDNEARRPGRGSVFAFSSPAGYALWLENACRDTVERLDPERRLVFINAWNEWAEGAHLEPDGRYGYAYLQAGLDVLRKFPRDGAVRRIVLVCHDAHPHGAQLLALHLARLLKEVFHYTVELVLLGEGALIPEYARHGTVHMLKRQGQNDPDLGSLLVRLRREGVSAALVNTCVGGAVVPELHEADIKVVVLVHEMPQLIRERHWQAAARNVALLADTVVFAARAVARGFDEIAPVKPEKVVIRPQGLYLQNRYRDRVAEARAEVRKGLAVPPDAQIVLAVGFGDFRKGMDLFAHVAAHVTPALPRVFFLWVGAYEPDAYTAARAVAEAAGCSDRLLFAGPTQEPGLYFAAADVYALTSREDPFPSVALEAMDSGMPVIGFEGQGGATELLQDGSAGILVPYLDTHAMADAVTLLLGDDELRSRLGNEGRSLVTERFTFIDYVFDLLRLSGASYKKVSVIVPNYNYARYLEQRLASILGQGYPVYELIVLDDASSDNSMELAGSVLDRTPLRTTLVRNEANSGSVMAQWRKGVGLARGEYVWMAEADDFAEPGFLEHVVQGFDDPHVVLSYCQSRQVDEDGRVLSNDYLDYLRDVDRSKWLHDYSSDGDDEIRDSLAIKNTIPNASAVVFRRAELARALAEERERIVEFRIAADWIVYLNVARQGKIRFVAQALSSHRRHRSSATLTADKLRHVREIVQVQGLVRERYKLDPEVPAKAAAFSQAVYERFGLATPEYPTYDTHPEIVAAPLRLGSKTIV